MNDFSPAHEELVQRLASDREELRDAQVPPAAPPESFAEAAQRYAGEHPWQVAGLGAALGVAFALLLLRGGRK